jgi:hypothetical protein
MSIVFYPKQRTWETDTHFPLGDYECCFVPMELFEVGQIIYHEIANIFSVGHGRDPTLICEIIDFEWDRYQENISCSIKVKSVNSDSLSEISKSSRMLQRTALSGRWFDGDRGERGEFVLKGRNFGDHMMLMSEGFYQLNTVQKMKRLHESEEYSNSESWHGQL